MTYEEAIKILELMRPVPSRGNGKSFLSLSKNVAIDSAIEALEKQIPKKPIVEPYFYGKYYRCPTCGRMVEKNKCCSNNDCCQCIDWSK